MRHAKDRSFCADSSGLACLSDDGITDVWQLGDTRAVDVWISVMIALVAQRQFDFQVRIGVLVCGRRDTHTHPLNQTHLSANPEQAFLTCSSQRHAFISLFTDGLLTCAVPGSLPSPLRAGERNMAKLTVSSGSGFAICN